MTRREAVLPQGQRGSEQNDAAAESTRFGYFGFTAKICRISVDAQAILGQNLNPSPLFGRRNRFSASKGAARLRGPEILLSLTPWIVQSGIPDLQIGLKSLTPSILRAILSLWCKRPEACTATVPLLRYESGVRYMSNVELYFAILSVLSLVLTVYFGLRK